MTETATTTETDFPSIDQWHHTAAFTDTVIEHDAQNNASVDEYDRRSIFVGRVMTPVLHSALLHRQVRGMASRFGQGWIVRYTDAEGNTVSARAYGSLMNPTPVHGHYYRVIAEGRQDMLLRYIDSEHVEMRNTRGSAWNIVAASTGPWPIPNDSYSVEPASYVEVECPEEFSEEASVDRQDTEPAVETIENAVTNNTHGMAEADDEGRAVLRPTPEIGGRYLYWHRYSEEAFLGTYVERHLGEAKKTGQFLAAHRVFRVGTEVRVVNSSDYITDPVATEDYLWVKAKTGTLPEPDAETLEGRKSRLRQQLTALAVTFTDLNEQMNELADEHEWCTEYEDIVKPLGFEGRESKLRNYEVEVQATIRIEDESPSSRLDNQLESEFGISMSASSIEVTADVTVYITVEDQPDAESAENYIDSDVVYSHIDNETTASFELVDYVVQTAREAD